MAWHHVLLVLAWAAIAQAALQIASLAAPRGWERVLAAAPLAATAVVIETLALGAAGFGSGALLLAGAAGVTWLAVRRLAPAPVIPFGEEVVAAWRALSPAGRAAVGALAGAGLAAVVAFERTPPLGIDGVIYHLTQAVGWIQTGRPGSVREVLHGFPVGNYPLTNEVALTWSLAIARSFAPVAPIQVAFLGLLAAAGWTGLRALAVPRPARALAVAALCATPLVVEQVHGPNTDLPATAWLVTAGALCAAALVRPGRPALLAPALLAGALAVGTKTTVAPLAGLLLIAVLVLLLRRERPAPDRRLLALAAAAALVAGGTWYVRNLLVHGSPLWPFVTAPWGDPAPETLTRIGHSLRERPLATLEGRLGDYLQALGGGAVLLAAALLAPLLARRREVALAAGATAIAAALWVNAPVTGIADDPRVGFYSITATRYLLPVLAAAALTVALAARAAPRAALAALGLSLLVSATAWPGISAQTLPDPVWVLLAGAAAGAALGAAVAALPHAGPAPALGLLVVAGVALSVAASGFVARHPRAGFFDAQVVAWLAAEPEFTAAPATPVAMGPVVLGVLAGDRLERPVELLPAGAPCSAVDARLRAGHWVILKDPAFEELLTGLEYPLDRCVAGRQPRFEGAGFRVYREAPAAAGAPPRR